jgi:hypothetical protein
MLDFQETTGYWKHVTIDDTEFVIRSWKRNWQNLHLCQALSLMENKTTSLELPVAAFACTK